MLITGDGMKKLFLIIAFFLLFFFFYPQKQETLKTFGEIEDYHLYEVHLEEENIRTTNFIDLFSSFEILSITPYINPLYEKKFLKKEYIFQKEQIDQNIMDFTKKYLETLKNLPYQGDYIIAYTEGIKLISVKLYAKESELEHLTQKYPSITYEENS